MLSKRQVIMMLGCNARTLETLIRLGVVKTVGRKVSADSLDLLVEGEHYVICVGCGAKQGQITTKHLKVCSGIDLDEYRRRWPKAPVMSFIVQDHRRKTEEQRIRQSQTLRRRFQTPEGEITRKQISDAAKRLMQTSYKERAVQHLRELSNCPRRRKEMSRRAKERWKNPEFRERIRTWNIQNREFVEASAANARRHLRSTFTKPHRLLEEALVSKGVTGMIREFEIGYYRVDEAVPDIKLAIEVDGCYWHGCEECSFPGVSDNKTLDRRKTTYLTRRGWQVIRVKECEVKSNVMECVQSILDLIRERRDDVSGNP